MTWEKLPDYGDHMARADFESACRAGLFVDYDGHGNYATADRMSSVVITPSKLLRDGWDTRFTHVMWFNK